MKKITAFLLFLLSSSFFTVCIAQYQYIDLHNFRTSHGAHPYGAVTQGGNVLYGMTESGGAHNVGCIYSLDTNGGNFRDLLDFNGPNLPDGAVPYGSLLLSGNKLFGMTEGGGTNRFGCVFSVDTDGTNYKDLINFGGNSSPNGADPYGSLIISGSTLYGMALQGGTGFGCIFSIDTSGTGYTDLHNFTGTTGGQYPYGALVLSGNELFGMTSGGGTSNDGLVFSLHTDGTAYNVVLNLSVVSGESPLGSVILNGNMLYGMTYQGGIFEGNIFCVDTNGGQYKNLHSFGFGNAVYPMYTQLSILGSTLYGMTGDYANTGCIFSMDTNGTAFNVIYNFTTPTGSNPFGALSFSGNRMYGTTFEGGTADSGVVFSFRQCSLTLSSAINAPLLCCTDSNGSMTVTASNGVAPYTYNWSTNPVQTNAQATALKAGTYTVTVNDNSGCMNTLSVTLTQPTCLQDSILGSPSLGCNCKGTIEVFAYGGTQPYTYLWSTGGTYDTVHNLKAGEYYVSVCDNHGCCIRDSFGVGSGDPVTLIQTPVTCHGVCDGYAAIATWGWNGYLWSPGGQTTASVSGLCAGSYTVTVTNLDTLCSAQYVFTFIDPPPVIVNASVVSNVLCYGYSDGKASASASGGTAPYTYGWSDGEHTATASTLPAGTSIVTVTDNHGCTGTASVTPTQPPLLTVTPAQPAFYACGNSSVLVSGTASGGTSPYNFTWAPNNNVGQSVFENDLIYGCGTDNVTVTDANGCMASGSYYLGGMQLGAPYNVTHVSCYGGNNGSATIMQYCGQGAFQYSWAPNGGNNPTATGLSAGTYTLTVTDNGVNASGCSLTETVTITQPNQLISTATANPNVSCGGVPNGNATVVVSGGTAPYTYLWSDGYSQTTATAYQLGAGTYTATVTDNNGCTATASATVTQPAAIILTADSINDNGSCNGSAWVTVNGGSNPYSYLWTGGLTTDTITNQCAGNYCCTVTDANGCIDSVCITINLTTGTNKTIANIVNIKIYQNPNNGVFTLHSSGTGHPWSVEIYDVRGQQIYSQFTIHNSQFTIDLSDRSSGIYFYRVLTETGSLLSDGKIVVEK